MCFICESWERSATDESPERMAALASLGRSLPPITSVICPVCDRLATVTVRARSLVTGTGKEHWADARARYRAENNLAAE